MKKFTLNISLKLKLLFEMVLSVILTLVWLVISSHIIVSLFISKNPDNSTVYYWAAMYFFISCIVVFILCFFLISGRHIKYINYITKKVKIIASGNLDEILQIKGNDELSQLCIGINSMSKELKDKFEHERDLERIKSELITNVSHDLRTPLTPIIAYLDILRNEKFNTREEEKEYLNSSYNLSIKLKKLIDELFEYTKLSSKEARLDLNYVDILPILNQIIGEYSPMIEGKGLKIVTKMPDVEILVNIDVEKIVRVFGNILSNAEKYAFKPSDIIFEGNIDFDNVVISISNKGEHLEQDKLDKMFEKFYRVDMSRSSNVEGSGLGLAICKKIVELHKGEIWAECQGDIITINIKLPIKQKNFSK
ncbi:histidine kinase [Clostridium acetobutylicum]|nr:histidine kinase [Clostridium acetobutylicum]